MARLFEKVTFNVETGVVGYPELPGFSLDMDRVYRTAKLFMPHCQGDVEMAVRQAVHQQLAAHKGAQSLGGRR